MEASGEGDDALPSYISTFNDIHGWYHASNGGNGVFEWRFSPRPRLYYPANFKYRDGEEYLAVDGMGRTTTSKRMYDCTINPTSGKFERLCVQTRDSICSLSNSSWDRTIIRNSAPRMLRLANFPFQGIHWAKRDDWNSWDAEDWWSVVWRWTPASLGLSIMVRTRSLL